MEQSFYNDMTIVVLSAVMLGLLIGAVMIAVILAAHYRGKRTKVEASPRLHMTFSSEEFKTEYVTAITIIDPLTCIPAMRGHYKAAKFPVYGMIIEQDGKRYTWTVDEANDVFKQLLTRKQPSGPLGDR